MRQAVVLLALAAGAPAVGLLFQTRMPAETGVVPSQKVIQVRLEQGSAHLADAQVRTALDRATKAWNAVLPADLQLVETPISQPLPVGEVVVLVRFDSDPSHFGKSGIDEVGDIRGVIDRRKNNAVILLFLVDTPGVLRADGAAAGHDLQLVMMHELGHVLGLRHLPDGAGPRPIMADALPDNGKLLAGAGKTLADLRQITADDRELLNLAMLRRKSRDFSGSYTGTLKVLRAETEGGTIGVGTALPVREGEFVVTFDAGKVILVYKGSKREVPAVDLLDPEYKLRFSDVADGRALRTMVIKRGNTPEEIEVEAVLQPVKVEYTVKGTLQRK